MSNSVKLNNGEAITVGLIDFHTHVFENVGHPRFNLNADRIGISRGVSTVVDQGGAGAVTLSAFKRDVVEKSQTHVQCFVSAYLVGGNPRGEMKNLYGPQGMDADKTIQAVQEVDPTLEFVRGVKAHCGPSGYDEWGIQPLKVAVEIASALKLPVYVHLGSLWNFEPSMTQPSVIVDQVLDTMRPGDVLAHPYRPNNGFVTDGQVHTAVKELKQKGVLFDVGRGTNFSFSNARLLLEQGMQPNIISSDLHGFSRPEQNSLFNSMSEMLHLGMALDDIVKAVSTTPRQYLKNCNSSNQIRLVEKTKTFVDSCGESIVVNRVFESCQNL